MKASLNQRTVDNLNVIMSIMGQTNHVHTINIIVEAFLENLKSDSHSSIRTKKRSVHIANKT